RATAAQSVPGAVAHVPDDGLHDQTGEGRRQPKDWDLVGAGAQVFVNGAHVRHLEAPAKLNAEEPKTHVPDLPETQPRLSHGVHSRTANRTGDGSTSI